MKTEERGVWSDFAQEGLDKMQKRLDTDIEVNQV